MDYEKIVTLGTFMILILTTSWKLHSELSAIKLILKELSTRFEQVGRLEKRVERLEKRVFDLDQMETPD